MPHIDTTDKSVWLEHGSKENKKFHADLSKKYEGIAPTVFEDRIKGCLKALKIKKVTDLSNGDNMRHHHILSILRHACEDEHNLICSHYEWGSLTKQGDEITDINEKRMSTASLYLSELNTLAVLMKLPKGTILYEVPHENKNKNYYTFFVLVEGKPYNVSLKCLGFKFGVLDANPYHSFTYGLGKKLFDDDEHFIRGTV